VTKTKHSKGTKLAIVIAFIFILLMAIVISACSPQPESKTYRVGVLSGLEFVSADIIQGFKEGMTELGYVEGENVVYDIQRTDFDMDAYKSILQQFVDDGVDVILTFPTEATMEAKTATEGTDIPVVFTFALIDGLGIVDSIREPGGNITGVRYPGPDVALRRFEVLRELVPGAKRILMPYQRGYPIVQPQLDILYPAAEAAGVTLIEAPADNGAELESIFQEYAASGDDGIDAILLLVEPLVVSPDGYAAVAAFAAEHQIPFGGAYVAEGDYRAVFGVNADLIASGKQAAPLIDKIFQGIDPGTIPVASAETYFELDYKMAQELGLEVPEGLLVLADKVYR
jgi:putative tryptophan/tyrosine transport system substrate-binding protein